MRIIVLISIVFLQFSLIGQERSFTISLEKDEILIGQQTELKIEVSSHAADTVRFPIIEDTLITEIEILNRTKIDTHFSGDNLEKKSLSQVLRVTSFDSGYFAIKPLVASVNGDSVASNPLLLTVQTIPIDTAKGFVDIKPLVEVPFSLTEWLKENWHWIVIAILLLGAITWIALWFSRREVTEEEVADIPVIPPHEIALKRLLELKESKLWQQDKVKVFYSELTDILREYVENKYHIPALEQTTDEIIQSMRRQSDFSAEQIEQLKRLLFLSDLVKFAKEKPVGSENEVHIASVEDFIKQTTNTEEKQDG